VRKALIVEESAKNLVVRFNRPEIRSPLSVFVLDELHEILDRAAAEKGFSKIIFTGKDDCFASGADLREIARVKGAESARGFAAHGQSLMNKIARSDCVAAVNGFCFGGALDLALACRKRTASPAALFSHPGANLGIMTGWGGTQRLPRLIGKAAALEMFFTARRVTAEEALMIGLIDRIADDPLAAALELSN
jgi:enoyl-CoA hydratase/carnithine racemase